MLLRFSFFWCLLFATEYTLLAQHASNDLNHLDFKKLEQSHDVSLSAWGPYSKKYAGISHIPDFEAGLRFDFSVMPGYYRNKVLIPNVRFESGYFPWDFRPDVGRFTYRYELEWKDKVFVDVTYSIRDSSSVLVEIRSVNHTDLPQNLALNLMAFIDHPENYATQKIVCLPGAHWYNALTYESLDHATKSAKENLVYDGWLRAEVRNRDFIDGRAIGNGFGKDAGDKVKYLVDIKPAQINGKISLVYKVTKGQTATFKMEGLADRLVKLEGTGSIESVDIPFTVSKPGNQTITLVSTGSAPAQINGFVISSQSDQSPFSIQNQEKQVIAQTTEDAKAKNMILKYQDIKPHYGIAWKNELFQVREVRNSELDIYFKDLVHNHVDKIFQGDQKGSYSNVFIRPVELLPHSEKTEYALISTGSADEVRNQLERFSASHLTTTGDIPSDQNTIYEEGKQYAFSQKMLQATILSNVVYPVYTQNSYIRNFSPGKWWNSLYTWDSGFIALGMNHINKSLAAECINAYTTPASSQSAFIHHGSPLPVQAYAFFDLCNGSNSMETIRHFYPRLKRQYLFIAGKYPGSTFGTLQSGLLKSWDYFYNSAGWDDYPPQVGVHAQKQEDQIAPVSNTAHAIRVAKMLRMMAVKLGEKEDIKAYDQQINTFSNALQRHSWDAESGYFGYVTHDQKGNADGIFRFGTQKVNYNMGLDGVSPLIAGICSEEQEKILTERLFSATNLWTESGISAVDQSAPYYKIDGYWNGSVWMPHQWFIWKTLLDLGKPELAFQLAQKALDVWKTETDASYYTFEHFLAKSGRGAGWHQFSGLSSPVLCWFASYFKVGTVTTGFETWIDKQAFNPLHTAFTADLTFDTTTKSHQRSMLVAMDPGKTYEVFFNGKKLTFSVLNKGLLQIILPNTNASGKLEVRAI
jgi:neutral trehalase